MKASNISIVQLEPEHYLDFVEHMARHVEESGVDGVHFMPFIPGDTDRPKGVIVDKLLLSIEDKGWHRCWLALDTEHNKFVGHIDLKGSNLKTSMHRCELGLGIEKPYRAKGVGRALMQAAIAFARKQKQLEWIDLCTFTDNIAAYSLYKAMGFKQVGLVVDRFRINDSSIDDIAMALNVKE